MHANDITPTIANALATLARAYGVSPSALHEVLEVMLEPALDAPDNGVFACVDGDGDIVAWTGKSWVAWDDEINDTGRANPWVPATPGDLHPVDQACADAIHRVGDKPSPVVQTAAQLVREVVGPAPVVKTSKKGVKTIGAALRRKPRNYGAVRQTVDLDGDHVALMPNGKWVVFDAGVWAPAVPNFGCDCVTHGVAC